MGVDPSHSVADAAGAFDDFEDLTLARKLSGLVGVNDDRVSGLCVHHNSPVDVTVHDDSAREVPDAPGSAPLFTKRRPRRDGREVPRVLLAGYQTSSASR